MNFSPSFRASLSSRFILALRPGGSLEDKVGWICQVINDSIGRADGMEVDGRRYHVFHFNHKSDSPERHEILGIPKPSGLCFKKCSVCEIDRDHMTDFSGRYPFRDVHNPFPTESLPADILHMEGRTMLKIVLPLYVKEFASHHLEIMKKLQEYKCGKNLSLIHSTSFTAHHFYEISYVLPSICSSLGVNTWWRVLQDHNMVNDMAP
ncbi:hypothetical protein ADUPG1_012836 [Aduncisulcus paluster]|uniref:Uncharacterized protein n=1 Tax=Aduncisulcus paluster TaxID=2918883 RepID=A0ABQ5K2M9_9EUKA|nr:hypothetical protein ADUPG1_012836 [Aduncisulcus paluster]